MNPRTSAIQTAFRSYIDTVAWHDPHAFTLTMKQGRMADGPTGQIYVPISNEAASNNVGHFLNRLNKKLYGNAATRFGKKVQIIPVFEGGNHKRLHVHGTIDCPRPDLRTVYPALIAEIWSQTPWGYHQTQVQPDCDRGWTTYFSKTRDKPNYADAIDWKNVHVLDR